MGPLVAVLLLLQGSLVAVTAQQSVTAQSVPATEEGLILAQLERPIVERTLGSVGFASADGVAKTNLLQRRRNAALPAGASTEEVFKATLKAINSLNPEGVPPRAAPQQQQQPQQQLQPPPPPPVQGPPFKASKATAAAVEASIAATAGAPVVSAPTVPSGEAKAESRPSPRTNVAEAATKLADALPGGDTRAPEESADPLEQELEEGQPEPQAAAAVPAVKATEKTVKKVPTGTITAVAAGRRPSVAAATAAAISAPSAPSTAPGQSSANAGSAFSELEELEAQLEQFRANDQSHLQKLLFNVQLREALAKKMQEEGRRLEVDNRSLQERIKSVAKMEAEERQGVAPKPLGQKALLELRKQLGTDSDQSSVQIAHDALKYLTLLDKEIGDIRVNDEHEVAAIIANSRARARLERTMDDQRKKLDGDSSNLLSDLGRIASLTTTTM